MAGDRTFYETNVWRGPGDAKHVSSDTKAETMQSRQRYYNKITEECRGAKHLEIQTGICLMINHKCPKVSDPTKQTDQIKL